MFLSCFVLFSFVFVVVVVVGIGHLLSNDIFFFFFGGGGHVQCKSLLVEKFENVGYLLCRQSPKDPLGTTWGT